MTVYRIPLQSISEPETRRYAGLAKCANFPEDIVRDACTTGLLLSTPYSSWIRYGYNPSDKKIEAPSLTKIKSRDVADHIKTAVYVVMLAVTIGPTLEQEVNKRFAAGQYASGHVLDAAGTTAVEQAADEACKHISAEASRLGLTCTSRFSPGYGDWDIKDQPWVLELTGGKEIGVIVNDSCILSPRKSITAIIGLIPPTISTEGSTCKSGGCGSCTLTNCLARKEHLS